MVKIKEKFSKNILLSQKESEKLKIINSLFNVIEININIIDKNIFFNGFKLYLSS